MTAERWAVRRSYGGVIPRPLDADPSGALSGLVPQPTTEHLLKQVHRRLRACRSCVNVSGGAVHGPAFETPVMLIGQAPGVHESSLGRPFAYTAGRTLFQWFERATGGDEETIRQLVYFSAVLRCFPGKATSGAGDRVPNGREIENCRGHLTAEVRALKPKLILAVGRLAITEVLGASFPKTASLASVVGDKFRVDYHGVTVDVIPLPHPSGVSRWPKMEPGKTKLAAALSLIGHEFQNL